MPQPSLPAAESKCVKALIKGCTLRGWQPFHGYLRLLEHVHEGGVVALVIHAAPRQQANCLLAVEDRKVSDALRKPFGLLVIRDCFLRLRDGDILPLHEVRTNPARDCLPVGFQWIWAETKPRTEKSFVVPARSMQIFDQPQEASTVEAI